MHLDVCCLSISQTVHFRQRWYRWIVMDLILKWVWFALEQEHGSWSRLDSPRKVSWRERYFVAVAAAVVVVVDVHWFEVDIESCFQLRSERKHFISHGYLLKFKFLRLSRFFERFDGGKSKDNQACWNWIWPKHDQQTKKSKSLCWLT